MLNFGSFWKLESEIVVMLILLIMVPFFHEKERIVKAKVIVALICLIGSIN